MRIWFPFQGFVQEWLTRRGCQSEYCHLHQPPNALMLDRSGYHVLMSTMTYATTYIVELNTTGHLQQSHHFSPNPRDMINSHLIIFSSKIAVSLFLNLNLKPLRFTMRRFITIHYRLYNELHTGTGPCLEICGSLRLLQKS